MYIQKILAAGVVALTALSTTAVADEWIAIQANDGLYVRAGVTQQAFLAKGSPAARGWETFKLIRLSGGNIALQSKQNGK
jgi:hypothetical protein